MVRAQKTGLFKQIYIMMVICIAVMGLVTAFSQYIISGKRIRAQTDIIAEAASGEVISSVKEYPAYRWLLSYWAEHAGELDVEYDSDFSKESVTLEKFRLLRGRHPDFDMRFCSNAEAEALPQEDQKLYAEIVYAWLVARMDEIKQNFECDFLYCAVTDIDSGEHPYENLLFLFSGADPDSVRGSSYGEVYTLGVTVPVSEDTGQEDYLRQAVEEYSVQDSIGEDYDNPGQYVDYYTCLCILEDKAVFTGTSFSLREMRKKILSSALLYSMNTIFLELLLLNLVMWFVARFILNPLRQIIRIIRAYAEAKDSAKAEKDVAGLLSARTGIAIRKNEVGQLAEDFINVTHELDDYTVRIREAVAAQKRIEVELETAAAIQLTMLPDGSPEFPDHPEFKLSASMKPAKEVGGDFYDYFLIDDTHLILVMADVSDKGVPAALFMAEARTLIRSRAQIGEEPEQILYYVNNQLSESNKRGYFVTVWLALLDLETGEGIAINAGHEHPAVCRKGGDFELVIYKHSLAAGIMQDVRYVQHSFCMKPGDSLFIYTDGVPEAQNMAAEQFGTDRMLQVLRANQDADPAGILNALTKEIDAFMGEASRFDDTTMMCLKYIGKGMDEENGPAI